MGTWSFTADMVQYGPVSARALGKSTSRSDAVSSLGSIRWSSRISCMSGVWSSAGMNSTKPLREVARTQFMLDSTHSGGRWRNCCNAWRSRRWTSGSRTSTELLSSLRNSSGVHPNLAGWAAAILSFIDRGCCMERKMRRSPGDFYTVYTCLHGRRTP